MMLKKSHLIFVQKNKFFRRAVEGLFLSTAGPKRGWSSYLIAIIEKETSGLYRVTLIVMRYEKHHLFGPALDRNEHSTARPKKVFFAQKSGDLFLASYV